MLTLKIQELLSVKMRKLDNRESKSLVQGHTAGRAGIWTAHTRGCASTTTLWTSKAHEPFVFTWLTQYTPKGNGAKVTGEISLITKLEFFKIHHQTPGLEEGLSPSTSTVACLRGSDKASTAVSHVEDRCPLSFLSPFEGQLLQSTPNNSTWDPHLSLTLLLFPHTLLLMGSNFSDLWRN